MNLAKLISANTQQQIDALYAQFLTLGSAHQTVLYVLAVVHKPIGAGKLQQIISLLCDTHFLSLKKKEYVLTAQDKQVLNKLGLIDTPREGLQISALLANKLVYEIGNLDTQWPCSEKEKLNEVISAAEQIVPVFNSYSWQNKLLDQNRLIRDLYFHQAYDEMIELFTPNKNPQIVDHKTNSVLVHLLFVPFTLSSFMRLPSYIQYQAFASLFRTFQKQGESLVYPTKLLEQVCTTYKSNEFDHLHTDIYVQTLHLLLAEQYLYQARFDDFKQTINTQDASCYALQLLGAYHFLIGQNKQALTYFTQAIKSKNKYSRKKKQYLDDLPGYFYKLALIVEGNQNDPMYFQDTLDQIDFELNQRQNYNDFECLAQHVIATANCLSKGTNYSINIEYRAIAPSVDYFAHQLCYFNYLLGNAWCTQTREPKHAKTAHTLVTNFSGLGYELFAQLSIQLENYYLQKSEPKDAKIEILSDITQHIKLKESWDLALDKLIALTPKIVSSNTPQAEKSASTMRLVWELSDDFEYSFIPREQKRNRNGWSKGRVVSLKRLKENINTFSYLSDSDKRLIKEISIEPGWGYYNKMEYALRGINALKAAIGIDNLYFENQLDENIEIFNKEPELLITEQDQQLCLSIADLPYGVEEYEKSSMYTFKQVSDTRYQFTEFSKQHISVAKIVGEGGLLIPISAKQKALEGISAIAPLLNIQSNIDTFDTGLQSLDCDSRLVINIQPNQQGLTFSCWIMPFGEKGPSYKPGIGNANLSAEVDSKRVATTRDLIYEQSLLDELDKACPAFLAMADNNLILEDTEAALSALEQLEHAVSEKTFELTLRWPKGKKITLTKALKSEHLQLAIHKNNEWFDINGHLQVNEEKVIEFRQLLTLLNSANGRFIQLNDEQILVLSESLKQKLAQIDQVSDEGKFHALASLQVEQATTGMRMKTLHAWEQQTQKMHQANEIQPQLPSTFQGSLRDYQFLGFDWAMRLAHWGAGACLADDMGLGKTLQALATILARAKNGPSLVLAPTSVCLNWINESHKFTPTLNMHLFADQQDSQARKTLLEGLKAFDVLVISYGLLQRESELLQDVQWQSIVADEAQALKNPLAKRTKAAYSLKSEFKMITTGTPIENDLTELWSLFKFINPGLLGNLKRFSQLIIQPIANAKDDPLAARKASQRLKALIQPFILRRLKSQVLTELPPRTEINIQVEMSQQERDFYEALRLNAIDNISQNTQQSNLGEQRIRMLAELVRLRQACCHPKLVNADINIPSAKLTALQELLQELLANNHKALIFSQFVGHLSLIKQHLEQAGVSYQYLDGTTAQKERQKRVDAFQAGNGEVFLISLKAGGSGLNLTAADYVIHMDPWWNPAVEEQASDRAHRMGQKRPVTIYRLISQNTIEQKIVALHQQKRDLADSLLKGNETANKLSVDDMLNLLKDTF